MLMYLSILDTQDEKEKFTEVYEQYQHFCWYVANQMLSDESSGGGRRTGDLSGTDQTFGQDRGCREFQNPKVSDDDCEKQGH